MLILDVKVGDKLHIEGIGSIEVKEKSGRRARLALSINNDPEITITKSDEFQPRRSQDWRT